MNSWIWVIDWKSEMVKPMTSEVTRIGAESFSATTMVCRAMLMTVVSVTAAYW